MTEQQQSPRSSSTTSGFAHFFCNAARYCFRLVAATFTPPHKTQAQMALGKISRAEPVDQRFIDALAATIRLTITQPGKMEWISLIRIPNAEQVYLENRCACSPFLKNAVEEGEGCNLSSRAEYEGRRIIQLNFLPEYVRSMCLQECQQQFCKVRVSIDSRTSDRDQLLLYARKFNAEHIKQAELLELSQFLASVSFESGLKVLDALKPTQFKPHYSVTARGNEVLVHDRFNPGSDGPLGKAATDAWHRMSKIALAAAILEDLLPPLGPNISEDIKRSAIERALSGPNGSPWNVPSSRLIKNATELHELYEAGAVSAKVVNVIIHDHSALNSTRISDKIADTSHTLAQKEARCRESAIDPPPSGDGLSYPAPEAIYTESSKRPKVTPSGYFIEPFIACVRKSPSRKLFERNMRRFIASTEVRMYHSKSVST